MNRSFNPYKLLRIYEIWDSAAWNTYLEDREKGFADVSTEVLPGLF